MKVLPVQKWLNHIHLLVCMRLYLESYYPGNLDSIQVTFYLRNTTTCGYGLDETKEEEIGG